VTIKGPQHPVDHPDRVIDCDRAIEPLFHAMAVEALAAGWAEEDVSSAMLNLAATQIKAMIADKVTDSEVRMAVQMIKAVNGKGQ
jgi:hypothetical protein